ncbi:MAG: DEAD/DEAH box helicase [Spirochaetales bacterium]|nr:DEAD/DEAH box helicase [Spirochaetales bacterium]
MNPEQFRDFLKSDPTLSGCISGEIHIPARPARYAEMPEGLSERLQTVLTGSGQGQLYLHQAQAFEAARAGHNTVVVTPTASGKTLTYLLPIFQRKLENPHSRALLLFPTKALSQDQLAGLDAFNTALEAQIKIFTYDGDTAPTVRRRISEAGDFVITNPDMLHAGILPHHTTWIKLFENLEFVVIDELHTYRGIFGSQVANVIRRLKRICAFYGSRPRFLTCSATIGNPAGHARTLLGEDVELIDQNGAPSGDRYVFLYNPPVVNPALGVRASALKETARLGAHLIRNRIKTIFFGQSRNRVELLFSYLCERCPLEKDRLRSYRGGYLPDERRAIEKELRAGNILGVVSTNALELGIDIGSLDVAVSMGYPGSISSMWQQFGRAGRRQSASLAVLVATSAGLDQYLARHPEVFFGESPENAIIHPDNILIASDHIKCAAFELPFQDGEAFADFPATQEILNYLCEHGVLIRSGSSTHWMSDVYPANTFSLRSGPRQNFAIIDVTQPGAEKVIGEIDYFSAPTMIHTDAIYLHQGEQYYVDELLWDQLQARVRKIRVDYYTDAQEKVEVEILEDEKVKETSSFKVHRGELALRRKVVMFKKIKLETHENLGWGDVHTPEIDMHTQAAWITLPDGGADLSRHQLGATLAGAAQALSVVAPLHVLCEPRDLRFRSAVRDSAFQEATIYFYDSYPGGLELAYHVVKNLAVIARAAADLIAGCACQNGCPSCTGLPDEETQIKESARHVLSLLAQSF